jgi:autotransporter-associated beta strand protein
MPLFRILVTGPAALAESKRVSSRLKHISTTALATGVIASIMLFQPSTTMAQSVWNGAGTDYGTAANWTPNAVATGGAAGMFNNTGAAAQIVDLGAATFTPGTIAINGSTAYTIQNGTLTLGTSFTNSSSANQTVSAILGGAGDVTQFGTGTLTLSGVNTYAGATTVTQGILQLGNASALGSVGGNVRVNGGTLDLGGFSVAKSQLILESGGVLQNGTIAFSGPMQVADGSVSAVLGGAGELLKLTGGTVVLLGANTYTGATTVNAGILRLGAAGVIPNASALVVNGGTLDLNNFAQTVGSLSGTGGTIATGGIGGRLDVNQTVNGVYAGSFSGPTDGVTSFYLQKMGAGTLTLSGTNTATGNGRVYVTDGRLILQNGNAVGDNNILEVIGAATVELQANETIGALLSGAGGTIQLNANTLTLAGVGIATLGSTAATITGTGGLTLNAASYTQVFTQPLAYTGATTILNGAFQFGGNNIIADGSSVVINGASAALNIVTFSDTVAGVSLQAGTIAGTTGVLTSLTDVDAQSGSISAILGGAAGLTKTTAGTVTLSGANTYTGTTTITAGILQLGAAGVIPDASAVIINGGTLNLNNFTETVGSLSGAGGTVATGGVTGRLIVNQAVNGVYAGSFSGATGLSATYLQKDGAGTLTLSGTNTATGAGRIWVTGGRLILQSGNAVGDNNTLEVIGGSTVELQANETIGGVLSAAGSTIQLNANTLTLAGLGVPASAVANLTITGTGGLTINGTGFIQGFTQPLSYTGATTILNGKLELGGNNIIANGSSVVINGASAILDIQSFTDTVAGVSLQAGSIAGTTGVLTSLTDVDAQSGSISAVLGGAAGLTKTTAGTVTLSGANTYTGATTINAGTLAGGAANAFSAASATTINTGGTLNLGGFAQTINAVALAGGTLTNGTLTGAVTSTGGTINTIAGTATVTTTAGLTIATGANTYTGATTINGGELRVNGSLGNTAVAVNNTGTLSGIGTIGGAVTVNAGGTLSAGQSPGTLTVGSLTLNAGSNSVFELNSPGTVGGVTNDLVISNGPVQLGGTLTATAASAGFYRLISVVGGGAITGNYATVNVAGFTGQVYTNAPGAAEQVNLAVLGAGQIMQFWDGADTLGNGTVDGGAGTWDATSTSWTGLPGQAGVNAPWQSSVGVFQGTAGVVTVGGTQAFQVLQFNVDGYTLNGGQLGIGVVGGGTINVNGAGLTTTINSAIVDGVGTSLSKVGAGTLNLGGVNTYTGGTTVLAGTLGLLAGGVLASNVTVGAVGTFNNAGTVNASVTNSGTTNNSNLIAGSVTNTGTLMTTGTIQSGVTNSGTVNAAGTINGAIANNAGTFTVSGVLAGNGAFSNAGGAILAVNGGNFTGLASLVNAGSITIGAGRTLSAGTITNNAGTIALDVGAILQGTANTLNNAATINVATNGAILDAGAINNLASGVINFNGPGGTATLSSGLQVNNAGAINLIGGNLNVVGPLSNTGQVAIAANLAANLASLLNAGSVSLGQGARLTTSGNLANTGMIELRNGATNNLVTVGGGWSGNGRVGLDLDIVNAAADRISVGGASSGLTTVSFAQLTSTSAVLNRDVLVVNGAAGAQFVAANALAPTGPSPFPNGAGQLITNNGLVQYWFGEATPGSGTYVVRPDLNVAAATGFVASVSSALASINAFSEPASAFINGPADPQPNTFSFGTWGRARGGHFDITSNSTVGSLGGVSRSFRSVNEAGFNGFQLGVDAGLYNINGTGWTANLGVHGGKVDAKVTTPETRLEVEQPFYGVYGAVRSGSGFAFDVLVRRDNFDLKLNSPSAGLTNAKFKADGWSGLASMSQRFNITDSIYIDPSVAVLYSRAEVDPLRTLQANVSWQPIESITGRFGVQLGTFIQPTETIVLAPYIAASVWREFAGKSKASGEFGGLSFPTTTDRVGTYGQFSAGLAVSSTTPGLSGFVRADLRFGERIEGYAFNGGLRYQF